MADGRRMGPSKGYIHVFVRRIGRRDEGILVRLIEAALLDAIICVGSRHVRSIRRIRNVNVDVFNRVLTQIIVQNKVLSRDGPRRNSLFSFNGIGLV